MTKKKSSLWLHQPKKRKIPNTSSPNKWEWTADLLNTPSKTPCYSESPTPKKLKVHRVFQCNQTRGPPSPLKITPKRQRVDKFSEKQQFSEIEYHKICTADKGTQTHDENSKTISEDLFSKAFEKLFKYDKGIANEVLTFLRLVAEEKYPKDNIAFLLFLDTVRFCNCDISSKMCYRPETKRFWKIGYKLFHSKFLYFMGGPKNACQIKDGVATRGKMSTESSQINFVVPSAGVLSQFNVSNVDLNETLQPGILHPVLDALQVQEEGEFMLCADAKKVTAGVDQIGGDVNMFGHEDGYSFFQRNKTFTDEIQNVNEIKNGLTNKMSFLGSLTDDEKQETKSRINQTIKSIGLRIKDGRELQFKQEYGLQKFKAMAGDKWRESKYVYVISSLQASLYQLREFTNDALIVVKDMAKLVTILKPSISTFPESNKLDVAYQENILSLQDDKESDWLEARYVKQRSSLWIELRKKAYVTGSTLHDAIGLRGIKKQKEHFAKTFEEKEQEIYPEVAKRMKHGSENEIHAVATLVGYFLPTYFPECHFVEEGCHFLSGINTSTLVEVSPDGSLRKVEISSEGIPTSIGDAVAAIEIKCPFPGSHQMPVHYTLPEYYVCQCLSEMAVLGTDKLIYVSYSKQSATFFHVTFDRELWDLIMGEVMDIFDQPHPTQPRKIRPVVQTLKERIKCFVQNNVTFMAEIPALEMVDSGHIQICTNVPFRVCVSRKSRDYYITLEDALMTMEKAKGVIESGYNLLRRRATEVMVWVLTNKNRNSKLEIPCSLPIAYGLKDYKLTNQAFRNATEEVLRECKNRGIRVLSFATDGQWIQNMVRDANHKPLTIYELQKDVWDSVRKLQKPDLVRKISALNRIIGSDDEILSAIQIDSVPTVSNDGVLYSKIYVSSKSIAFQKIQTSPDEKVWFSSRSSRQTDDETKETSTESADSVSTEWLPEDIVSKLQDQNDTDITTVLGTIERESDLENELHVQENFFNSLTTEENNAITENPPDLQIESEPNSINVISVDVDDDEKSQTERSLLIHCEFIMDTVLQLLKSEEKTGRQWRDLDRNYLSLKLTSKSTISTLTHNEINTIYKGLISVLPTTLPILKISWKKDKKIEVLGALLGMNAISQDFFQKRTRCKVVKPLRQLAVQAIQSKKYPKMVLCAAYASYVYPTKLEEWQLNSTVDRDVKVEGFENDIPFWFSYPELNQSTGEMLSKTLDCSHNLTHLRVLTCTKGFGNVSSNGWKACARSNATALKIPLVDDIIDKQSVPNARTHFSLEVENWLRENDFEEAAILTNIVRNWYEACDTPGISSIQRVQQLINMRKFILKDTDFGEFPPKRRYINGIPIVTFQGMCIDIGTKLHLYGMTSSYNTRSVGSLAAETTVGVLQSLSPVSQVSIKARDVPVLMSSLVEVMTCKINTDRGFFMRTSKQSGVYPVYEGDVRSKDLSIEGRTLPSTSKISTTIIPRDNLFDKPERRAVTRKIKFGSISNPNEPARGALPVRQFHRKDESKILPTKRLGLSDDS